MRREYVYLNGQPLAQIAGSTEVLTYLHVDHLGTPRYGTATGGGSVWAWANDAFGISTPTGTRTVDLRLPGQLYDAESGLFYNWNRYYNPAIGRYISPDPIGQAGGINLFDYVYQNPVMGMDPWGLDSYQSCVANYANCWALQGSLIGSSVGIGVGATGGTLVLPGVGTIAGAQALAVLGLASGSATGYGLGYGVGSLVCNETDEDNNVVQFPSQDIKKGLSNNEPPEDPRHENCLDLKNSILNTCAGLSGKKKFACFAAAQATYDACME